jgi:hypothetical protein
VVASSRPPWLCCWPLQLHVSTRHVSTRLAATRNQIVCFGWPDGFERISERLSARHRPKKCAASQTTRKRSRLILSGDQTVGNASYWPILVVRQIDGGENPRQPLRHPPSRRPGASPPLRSSLSVHLFLLRSHNAPALGAICVLPLKQQPALTPGLSIVTRQQRQNKRNQNQRAPDGARGNTKRKLATKGQKVKGSIKLTLDDTALISHTA